NYLGDPDNGVIVAGYVGSLLLAGSYLAMSCMTSAMTRNQVISFIVSVMICLFLILAGYTPVTDLLTRWANPTVVSVIAGFSVMTHFESFQRGVLDLRDVIFFASVIGFALFTTGVIIRNQRAGEGAAWHAEEAPRNPALLARRRDRPGRGVDRVQFSRQPDQPAG